MKQLATFILLSITLVVGKAQANEMLKQGFSKNQLEEDFAIFESSLKNNHPKLDFYTPMEELDSLFRNTKSQLQDGMEAIDFYRLLVPIIAHLRNNHTHISPPKSFIDHLNSEAKRFPFRLHHDQDTLYVSGDYSEEYLIQEGSILLSINGIAIGDILDQFISNISSDGFNKTQALIRASNGFSRYLAYHYDLSDSFEISYLDQAKSLKKAQIKALKTSELAKNQKKRKSISIKQEEDYSFKVQNEIGILTISTFSLASANSFRKFLNKTFKELSKNKTTKLIIDLRNNLGGFPEISNELLSYLIAEQVYPIKTEFAITDQVYNEKYFAADGFLKHFQNKKFAISNGKYHVKGATKVVIQPKKTSYNADLFILMNGNSSSTTGHLIGLLKSYTNAKFVGEESGGNPVGIVADDILTLVLPNSQIEVKIPMVYSELNVNFKNTGRGILPDQEITESIADFLSEEDLILEKTIQWIKENK